MSHERLILPRGLVSFRAAPTSVPAPAAGAQPAAAPSAVAPPAPGLSVAELKDLQRRAFERGCEFERKNLDSRFNAMIVDLERAAEALAHQREDERKLTAQFAVEVALGVAEILVGNAVRQSAHDVKKMVDTVLHEAVPSIGDQAVIVALNPADLAELEVVRAQSRASGGEAANALSDSWSRVRLHADAGVPRAGCQVRAGGAELSTDVHARLSVIGERLRAMALEDRDDA